MKSRPHDALGTPTRVSPETLRSQAKDLQQMAVSEDRAAELAAELSQMLGTVSATAQNLDPEDEPTSYLGFLNVAAEDKARR